MATDATTLKRLLVVSPHCDDAILSCGDLLMDRPGATVVTAFAGNPPEGSPLTDWDAAAGFKPGDDVMGTRRREDAAAMKLVRARPVWLEFCDSQYAKPASTADLAAELARVVDVVGATAVMTPLGLFHEDHMRVNEATCQLLRERQDLMGVAYEDAIYRRVPGLLAQRLDTLSREGFSLSRLRLGMGYGSSARKRQAVGCYRSQLRALSSPGGPGFTDAFQTEGFWQLTT